MAFSQSDLDAVNTAIATGAMRVRFGDGREVQYQSGADLLRAKAAIEAELDASSASPPSRMTRVVFNNGKSAW